MASSFVISTWEATTTPTSTSLSSIDASHITGLSLTLVSAMSAVHTQTKLASLYQLSEIIRGAEASLTILSAQRVLATATATAAKSQATQAIFSATLNLKALADDENLYGYDVNLAANVIFTVLFGILLLVHFGYMTWLRFWYFGVCFFCGCGLEFAGYLARALAHTDNTEPNYFLCQIITLTIAPAFIMAGVYYLLGKLVVVHGRQYSMLKPVWYGYIFVCCDVISLVIQAIGGGMAASASTNYEDLRPGTHVMVAGIAFQVFSMTLFFFFWFDFLVRIHFHVSPNVKFSLRALPQIFRMGAHAEQIRRDELEPHYEARYRHLREKPLFKYYSLVITLSTAFIYIRCIYRVVELAQGWTGYLISHEVFLMCLDALMVFFTCLLLAVLHPQYFLGRGEHMPLRLKKKHEEKEKPWETDTRSSDTAPPDKEVKTSP